MATESQASVQLPRVAIRFCVQCKWNLRAAYYAQELLQTFSNTLGEVALIPVTGGIFTITLHHAAEATSHTEGVDATGSELRETVIWDRKQDGGFPETKELKNRVRNIVDPQKDMGHVDRALKKGTTQQPPTTAEASQSNHAQHTASQPQNDCEECHQAQTEIST